MSYYTVFLLFVKLLIITSQIFSCVQLQSQEKYVPTIKIDSSTLERFRTALQYKTICWNVGNYNESALSLILSFIEENYPNLHNSQLTEWQKVNNYSLLYKINGQKPSLKPYLMTAHLDVVPTDNQVWDYPPFEAKVVDGFIYARGTIDVKSSVFAILEAVEYHLKNGMKPRRTIYLAFGHDEECTGRYGAKEIVKILKRNKVRLAFIHDEGSAITNGTAPMIGKLVAGIGISEKGFALVELSVNTVGGHASIPKKESCIGILSKAVINLEANPHKPRLSYGGTEVATFNRLADYVGFPFNFMLRHSQFFSSIMEFLFSQNNVLSAMLRTTTAVTMFNAGQKSNVIAVEAKAVIDHRIHITQTVEEVIEYDKRIINDDRVKVRVMESGNSVFQSCHESSSSTPYCPGYKLIEKTIEQLWKEDVIVLPISMFALTDSRHYVDVTDNIYRFVPTIMQQSEASMIHGANERISVESYEKMINYFYQFIINADEFNGFGDDDGVVTDDGIRNRRQDL